MRNHYLKAIKPHSRLHLDQLWSEAALDAINELSWRVVIKPQRSSHGTYLFDQDESRYCYFQNFNGQSLWAVWGRNDTQVVKEHLNLLPLLVRDLADASRDIKMSSAHQFHWQRAATLAECTVTEDLQTFFDDSTLEIVRASLIRVRDETFVAETYIHGDFHPGNVLSRGHSSPFRLGVSDLENLTVGTAFVDVLYCAIWAQFADDSNPYWNLIRYLEHKHGRKLNEMDLGLSATLMIGQATMNDDRIRRRILNGLSWLINQLLRSNAI